MMKKIILLTLISLFMFVSCSNNNPVQEPSEPNDPVEPNDDPTGDSSEPEDPPVDPEGEPSEPEGPIIEVNPNEGRIIKVDYTNDGGASIPYSWNDSDTTDTVRKATYKEEEKDDFSIEFVGKWYNSTNKEEFQTKKDPLSYVRSCCDLVVKKVVIETYMSDMKVFLSNDLTGSEVSGVDVDSFHRDGIATEYILNSSEWSFLAYETYKGNNINIYSFTFYF